MRLLALLILLLVASQSAQALFIDIRGVNDSAPAIIDYGESCLFRLVGTANGSTSTLSDYSYEVGYLNGSVMRKRESRSRGWKSLTLSPANDLPLFIKASSPLGSASRLVVFRGRAKEKKKKSSAESIIRIRRVNSSNEGISVEADIIKGDTRRNSVNFVLLDNAREVWRSTLHIYNGRVNARINIPYMLPPADLSLLVKGLGKQEERKVDSARRAGSKECWVVVEPEEVVMNKGRARLSLLVSNQMRRRTALSLSVRLFRNSKGYSNRAEAGFFIKGRSIEEKQISMVSSAVPGIYWLNINGEAGVAGSREICLINKSVKVAVKAARKTRDSKKKTLGRSVPHRENRGRAGVVKADNKESGQSLSRINRTIPNQGIIRSVKRYAGSYFIALTFIANIAAALFLAGDMERAR